MGRKNNIHQDFLKNFSIKENIYMLGRIWADGYISKSGVELYGKEGDMEFLFSFLDLMGIKTINKRQRFNKGEIFGKPSWTVYIFSYDLRDFLIEYDYNTKSGSSPDKILAAIPEELKHYWWRGYFDGDGSLYIRKNVHKLEFWSVIDQNWKYIHDLCKKINIEYGITEYSRKQGKHKSSVINIRKYFSIKNFMEYIYPEMFDGFGLKRKFDSYLFFLQKTPPNLDKIKGISYINSVGHWRAFYYDSATKKDIYIFASKNKDEVILKRKEYIEKHGIIEKEQDAAKFLQKYYS